MSSTQRWFRVKESGKLAVRAVSARANLSIGRDPFSSRLRRTLDDRGIDTVLDIGANVGQYSAQLRSSGFAGRIVSVEPLPDAFEELSRRAAKDANWQTINSAVGAEPGSTVLNVSANSYSSSLRAMTSTHEAAAPGSKVVRQHDVRVRTVVDIVAELGLDPARTLLKVDTQGFEPEVLAGAADLLPTFAAVQLELSSVELYEGQQLFLPIAARLVANGFEVWSLDPGISDQAGRLLQCDALFVRTPER